MSNEIRRGSRRFTERVPGRLSHHGFSFGSHYDPERLSFGPMVCHDDHLLGPGKGFEEHAHESLEIITWVVAGSVVTQLGTLLLGYSYRLNPSTTLNLSVGAGITRDTPDVSITLRMPVTF